MVTCPRCKNQLEDNATFCDNCGASLARAGAPLPPIARGGLTCPKCGQPVRAGEAFCVNCGAALRGPAAAGLIICPGCGTAARAGAAFCDNCGASLSPARPQLGVLGEHAPSPPAVAKIDNRPSSANMPRLVVQPTNALLPFPPGKTEVVAGREDPGSNTFPEVNLAPYDPSKGGISRRHVRFSLRDGQWQIEDLNSTNFTFLNNQKVRPGQLCPLNNGDEIRLGGVTMRFFTS